MSFTRESLDALLAWLDSDRERAGQKYETIRRGLIRIFRARGFTDAEDLADVTINRVIDRLPDICNGYVGEPARYFRGVARNIILEARRRKEITTDEPLPSPPTFTDKTSDEYECLLKCLNRLSEDERDLALDYYLYRGSDKVKHHEQMAKRQKITLSTLRVRMHRIRNVLEICVVNCVRTGRVETKRVAADITYRIAE